MNLPVGLTLPLLFTALNGLKELYLKDGSLRESKSLDGDTSFCYWYLKFMFLFALKTSSMDININFLSLSGNSILISCSYYLCTSDDFSGKKLSVTI